MDGTMTSLDKWTRANAIVYVPKPDTITVWGGTSLSDRASFAAEIEGGTTEDAVNALRQFFLECLDALGGDDERP